MKKFNFLKIFVLVILIIGPFLFGNVKNVNAGCAAVSHSWDPASVSWKTVSSTETFNFTQNYKISVPDDNAPFGYRSDSYTTTDSCVAQPNERCFATGVGKTNYQDFDSCPQGWETAGSYQSPINRVDTDKPVCGNWTPTGSSQNYTLSGSTDATSGISVAGGDCTAPSTGGNCNVTISDIAGNSRTCTSPTYTPVTWTNYCTGANDVNGNNWQIWAYSNQTPTGYKYVGTGTVANGCAPSVENCVGIWGACTNNSQTYTITTPASGGGASCPYANGATQTCGGCDDGNACTTDAGTYPNCTHTNNPINGTWGCSGGSAVCNGASCGGTCTGTAPTCSTSYSCNMTAYLGVAGSGSYCADNATGPSSAWHIVSSCLGSICGVVCSNGYSASGGQCVATPTSTSAGCGAIHYSCSSGTSSGTTGDTTTAYRWNCVADTTVSCSEAKSPMLDRPTARISATSCTIATGASTCNSSVSWGTDVSMLNPLYTVVAVTRNNPANTLVSNNEDGYQVSNAINYGTSSYYVYINSVAFSAATVSASCASGTSWNGSACAVLGEGSLPDLTAGVVIPTTVATGMANTFSATISNTGTVSTGASFPYFFQVASSTGGSGTITDLASSTMTTLIASASNTATKSYTFSSAGTYSMRVCADKTSAAGGGVISESNENNNCGAWTNITATDSSVDGASCSSFVAPESVVKGASFPVAITMKNTGNTTWKNSTPYGLTLVPWPSSAWGGSVWNSLPSATIAPGSNATFNFNITAPSVAGTYDFNWEMLHNGVAWFGQQCLKNIIVTDSSELNSLNISANPTSIYTRGKTTLTWVSAGAISCTGTNFKDSGITKITSPLVSFNSHVEINPIVTTTYTINCTYATGAPKSDQVTVVVKKKPVIIEN